MNSCLFVVLECGKLVEFSIFQCVFLFLLLFFFLIGTSFLVDKLFGLHRRSYLNRLRQRLFLPFSLVAFPSPFEHLLLIVSLARS